MPPKKVPVSSSQQQGAESGSDNLLLPSSSMAAASDTPASMEHLCSMLQSFMTEQREKDEYLQREAAKQELRWKTMHHQFGLLQEVVRKGRAEGGREGEEGVDTVERQLTQILRCTQGGGAGPQHSDDPRHSSPPVHTQTMWPAPRMPTLKESDDIEHFLTMFERVALTANWPRGSWALHLVPLLDGRARAAYVAMDSEDIGDYQQVKDAILRKYEINKDTYRQRFRSSTGREDETPRELYTRLKGLYEKWMTPQETVSQYIHTSFTVDRHIIKHFLKKSYKKI